MLSPDQIYERLKNITLASNTCRFSLEQCEEMTPLINEIIQLKEQREAVILAHSYVSPEIIYTVADHVGDSYQLSIDAMKSDKKIIIFSAVKFMAETAKILNPQKKVYLPSKLNGCSLADSVNEQDMIELRKKYPKHSFICYINTSAEVKAHCEVSVTSSNVYDIVERYPNNQIVFLPDRLMGLNIIEEMKRRGVEKEIVLYEGSCYVHESYDPEMIDFLKGEFEDLEVVVHPECSPEIIKRSSYVGSTSQMMRYVRSSHRQSFFVLTECGLLDRLQKEVPGKKLVGSCTMCRYMKSNTLEGIKNVLSNPDPEDEINLSKKIIDRASNSLQNMFRYTSQSSKDHKLIKS